jgi:hypothetical protein
MRGRMAGMLRRILYALQVLRLIVLMLVGAGIGSGIGPSPTSHNFAERAEQRFSGAVLGALCGFAAELVVRQFLPIPQNIPPLRFSLRTLLIATTLIAVVLGVVMWSIR